jgi:hypothetical protein
MSKSKFQTFEQKPGAQMTNEAEFDFPLLVINCTSSQAPTTGITYLLRIHSLTISIYI